MIRQLVRIKLESNAGILSLFSLLQAVALFLVFSLSARDYGADGMDAMEGAMVILLLAHLVMASAILVRERKEKRTRMLSQLPVPSRAVLIADWCFWGIVLCIPAVFWLLSIVLMTGMDAAVPGAPSLLFWTSFFYLVAGTLTALAKEVLNPETPGLGPRSLAWILGAAAVLFALTWLASSRGGYTWPQLYLLFLLSAAGLIALDMRRHARAENYLG